MKDGSEKDAINQYISEIKKYPLLSTEETNELLIKYKKYGDTEALNKLTTHNLRLAYKKAKEYLGQCKGLSLLDLIQESNIIMMNAIKLFDINRGVKLSTYICSSIEKTLQQAIDNKDKNIRIPTNLNVAYRKYKRYIASSLKRTNIKPTKEEIINATGLSLSVIKKIEKLDNYNTTSLNNLVSDEDDQNELLSFVADQNNPYKEFENNHDDLNLMQNLYELLSSREYYIIYNRIIREPPKTLEELGKDLDITSERVRQIESATLKKIKNLLTNIQKNPNFKYKNKNIEVSKLIPLEPKLNLMLFYLKKHLSNLEYNIVYTKIATPEKDNINFYLRKFSTIPQELLQDLIKDIENLLTNVLTETRIAQIYNFYKKSYTIPQIFELNTLPRKSTINYQSLITFSEEISFETIEDSDYYKNLRNRDQRLIKKYYSSNFRPKNKRLKRIINNYINILLTDNLPNQKITLPQEEIKQILEENASMLSVTDISYFNSLISEKGESKSKANIRISYYYKQLLEQLKFGIYHYFYQNLTLEQIKTVQRKYPTLLTEEENWLINQYYGNDTPKKSYNELMIELGLDYVTIHDKMRTLRNRIIINYFNLQRKSNEISKELFLKYISDPRYEFSEESRKVSKLYLSGKNYQEISEITKYTTTQVSNFITEAIRKANIYNYKIIKIFIIIKEELEQICTSINLSVTEKNIIYDRIILNRQFNDISEEFKISIYKIKSLIQAFYQEYLVKHVPIIPENLYEKELNCHITDSVLTLQERELLLLSREKSQREVEKILNITSKKYKSLISQINTKIRERKLKLRDPEYGIISQEESLLALKEKNIPLTDREKDILSHLKELNGYELLTEKELAKKYKMSVASLRRRYKRIILSIKQYQNEEKSALSYKKDIQPIIKYFSEYDRKIINLYYKDKLTCKEISNKLQLPLHTMNKLLSQLKINIAAILSNHSTAKKYDFDYARSVLDKKDLPIYGNKKIKIEIYKLLFGENDTKKYTPLEIKQLLNLPFKEHAISFAGYSVMIAVEKYRLGEKKRGNVSEEDVENYYQNHYQELPHYKKEIYESFIRKTTDLNNSAPIPFNIIYDILQDRNQIVFKLEDTSYEEAKKMITSTELNLPRNIIKLLKEYYEIPERELMSGKEKLKVLRLLEPMFKIKLKNPQLKK